MSGHYGVRSTIASVRCRTLSHRFLGSIKQMLAIRLYISALTFIFLLLVVTNRGVGILEAVVTTCAVLYLILDVRDDLRLVKVELRMLQALEQSLSKLLR